MEINIKKCKDCVNHLSSHCPFYMNFFNDYMNDLITENGRIQLGINCFQSEEDKWLCDLMCGEVSDNNCSIDNIEIIDKEETDD